VGEVQNEQAGGVGRVTFDTDTLTAIAGGYIGAVNTNVSSVSLGFDQASACGSGFVDVGDITRSGVSTLEMLVETCTHTRAGRPYSVKGEAIEKVGAGTVVVNQAVGSTAQASKSGQWIESRVMHVDGQKGVPEYQTIYTS
jgi:hypothetical protein